MRLFNSILSSFLEEPTYSLIMCGAKFLLYFQASTKTKMSSAAIPITKKIPMIYKDPKYPTLMAPCTIIPVSGKLKNMIEMPMAASIFDPIWMQKYM